MIWKIEPGRAVLGSLAAREIETESIALKYCSQFYVNEEIECQKIGSGRQLSSKKNFHPSSDFSVGNKIQMSTANSRMYTNVPQQKTFWWQLGYHFPYPYAYES